MGIIWEMDSGSMPQPVDDYKIVLTRLGEQQKK